jgi:HEAT repeat protein
MPREQLLGLAADVERLLAAGVANAGTDALRRRGKTLRELGTKVPALVAIAEAAERVTDPTSPAPAFLDLLVMTRQVRASLATSGVDGPLTPLPDSGPWQTPVPVRDLQPVYEALTQSGPGREERMKDAAERKLFGDMRVVTALLGALADGYTPVADRVAQEGLPAAGPAVLNELQTGLDLNGKAGDARRLRALCRIDPQAGAATCRKALKEGSAALRVEALSRLPEVAGVDEAKTAGLAHCQDRNREVRAAAMTALSVGASTEVLEALLNGLADQEDVVRQAASVSLGALPDPGVTDRLLVLLQTASPAGGPAEETKKKKGKGGKTAAKAAPCAAERSDTRDIAAITLNALGRRKTGDLQAVTDAILPWIRSKDMFLSNAAVLALRTLGPVSDRQVPALIDTLQDESDDAVNQAITVLSSYPVAVRKAAVPALAKLIESGRADRCAALKILTAHLDTHKAAVLQAAKAALHDPTLPPYLQHQVLRAIGDMGPGAQALLPAVFDLFCNAREPSGHWVDANRSVVAELDPEGEKSIPTLIQMLGEKKGVLKVLALQALAVYGSKAKAAIKAVEPLTSSKEAGVAVLAQRALAAIQ